MKATPPVTETAAAANATAAKSNVTRSFSIEIPTPIAAASFKLKIFNEFALYNIKGINTRSQGRRAHIKGQSVPQMFPAIHLAIKSTLARSADDITTTIIPERAMEKPTPVKISFTGCSPWLLLYAQR
ncbi:Uncharacterised protein [Streptococcus pneumoniae]|nr:Uncharacterised protein [Streptococcus pneumoniae]